MSDTRFDLETALATWRRFLLSARSLTEEDVAELESHLLDEMDRLLQQGLAPEAAFWQAARRVGEYGALEASYGRVYWKKVRSEHRLMDELRGRLAMLKNYLRVAVRSLFTHRGFSLITISGLALGMAACVLIFRYIAFELSFDTFHSNAGHLYRITRTPIIDGQARGTDAKTWYGMGPAFAADLAEIKNYARYSGVPMSVTVSTVDSMPSSWTRISTSNTGPMGVSAR